MNAHIGKNKKKILTHLVKQKCQFFSIENWFAWLFRKIYFFDTKGMVVSNVIVEGFSGILYFSSSYSLPKGTQKRLSWANFPFQRLVFAFFFPNFVICSLIWPRGGSMILYITVTLSYIKWGSYLVKMPCIRKYYTFLFSPATLLYLNQSTLDFIKYFSFLLKGDKL